MKQDSLNLMVYSICRNKTKNDLNESCKNGSKYGPARIKQVRDTQKAKKTILFTNRIFWLFVYIKRFVNI